MARRALSVLTSLVCAVVLLAGLGYAVLTHTGYRPMPVLSGSMVPTLPVGSLAVVKTTTPGDVKVGDIVSFRTAHKETFTHRIYSLDRRANGDILFRTKGDANGSPDPWRLLSHHGRGRIGRLSFSVPFAGYALVYLKSLAARLVVLGLVLLLVLVMTLRYIWSDREEQRRAQRSPAVAFGGPISIVLIGVAMLVAAGQQNTFAAFTSTKNTSDNTFTVSSVAKLFKVVPGTATQSDGSTKVASGTADAGGNYAGSLSLNFGTANPGASFTDVFDVTNTSGGPLTVQLTTSNLPAQVSSLTFASTGTSTATLSAGATATVNATLSSTNGAGSGGVTLGKQNTTFPTVTYSVAATISATLSQPTITSKPASTSPTAAPSFAFTGGAGTGYACKLDSGSFAACTSPKSYSGLVDGSHTFTVHATSGAASGPDATYTWLVDTQAPITTDNVDANWHKSAVIVTLTPSDAGSGVQSTSYKVDGGASTTGTSITIPASADHSNDGAHTITYSSTDVAGNVETTRTATVKIDTIAPAQTLTLSSGGGAYLDFPAGKLYYKPGSGSFTLTDALSDNESGGASVTYPAIATTGWTHNAETVAASPFTSSAFSWASGASTPASYTITGADAAGNTSGGSLGFVADSSVPTGGALSVNGTAATAGGSSSTATSTSFAIGARTDWIDGSSGISSSTLTVQSTSLSGSTCGAAGSGGPFTNATTITGITQPNGIVGGACYIYTLTGTDRVGNATAVKTTVAVPFIPVVTNVARNGGNKKVSFTGTGANPAGGATSVTVTICTANTVPCPAGSIAGTATSTTVGADGSWTTGADNNNLASSGTFYAIPAQSSVTGVAWQFSTTNL